MLTRRGDTLYAPPRNDAYVVLLIISLVAMILGCALLWLDYSAYPDTKAPKDVKAPPPAVQPAAPPGGGGVQGAAGGQQPPQQPQQPPQPAPEGGAKQ
jgi:hypothetical protein